MARFRALVTGASAGLGREFAVQLAALGVDLVLVARDRARLDALASELRARDGREIEVLSADLLTEAGLAAVEHRVRAGDIDVLVNNAGFGLNRAFTHTTVEDETRMFDLLARVPMRLTHEVLPSMRSRGRGWVINVASMAAFVPGGSYAAAKVYLVALSRALHAQVREEGVTVTAVCPGFTHTEFHDRMGERALGIPGWAWADARTVVRDAIRGARRGRALVATDAQYRAALLVRPFLPDALLARLSARALTNDPSISTEGGPSS